MRRSKKATQGVALVLCLWFIAVISVMAMGFGYGLRVEALLTSFQADKIQALYLAQAGIYRAIDLLEVDLKADKKEDNKEFCDYIEEDWAQDHTGYLKSEGWFSSDEIDMQGEDISFTIIDEERKVNINTAPREVLEKLPGMDSVKAQAILDWRRDHGLFRVVDELMLVKEISPGDFYGSSSNLGLKDFCTVYPMKGIVINANTAPREVIEAVFNSGDAGTLISGRPFKSLGELFFRLNIHQANVMGNIYLINSNVFTIRSKGTQKDGRVVATIESVYDRSTQSFLSWRES